MLTMWRKSHSNHRSPRNYQKKRKIERGIRTEKTTISVIEMELKEPKALCFPSKENKNKIVGRRVKKIRIKLWEEEQGETKAVEEISRKWFMCRW